MEANDNDHDSTFGGDRESLLSSSTTLSSSVTRYHYEHGRRYHAYQAGKYYFPNDEKELKRMDIEHYNQKLQMDGRLFACPIAQENVYEVLDLGTGTGMWAIEMADTFPSAQVLGIDLSPVQPCWVPPNCKFEVDDFELDWYVKSWRVVMLVQVVTVVDTVSQAVWRQSLRSHSRTLSSRLSFRS